MLEPLIVAYGTVTLIVGLFIGATLTVYSLKELLEKRNVFGKITLLIVFIVFSPGIIPIEETQSIILTDMKKHYLILIKQLN